MKSQRMHTWVSVDGQRTGSYRAMFGRETRNGKQWIPPREFKALMDEETKMYPGNPKLSPTT